MLPKQPMASLSHQWSNSEVSGWLPGYKCSARENILAALNKKGYHINDSDVVIFTKWKYRPFRFIWQTRCLDKDVIFDIQDNEPFEPQIPNSKTRRKTRSTDVMDRESAAPPSAAPPSTTPGAALPSATTHGATAPSVAAPSSSVPSAATNLD